MKVILFGNRGSRPLGASEDSPFMRYGGDTTSVGVVCGNRLLALDTGSGFYKWGYTLGSIMKRPGPHQFDVLYSHYHGDHVGGIPQAAGLFAKGNSFRFFGPAIQGTDVRAVFEREAREPYNPDLSKVYRATIAFNTIGGGDYSPLDLGDGITVEYMPVPHGKIQAYAYKIRQGDQCFTMISDVHHHVDDQGKPVVDPAIAEFIHGSKVLIYDCHFTDADYAEDAKRCQAFGHSTGEHGVRLAQAAGVPILVKHHHDPMLTDLQMDAQIDGLREYARDMRVRVLAAKPSLCLDLGLSPSRLYISAESQVASASRYRAIASPDRAPA